VHLEVGGYRWDTPLLLTVSCATPRATRTSKHLRHGQLRALQRQHVHSERVGDHRVGSTAHTRAGALSSGGCPHQITRLALAVVAAVAVAAFFDYASTYRFTTHSSGAIVVTGSVMPFFLSLCWLLQPPTFSFRTSSKLQHHPTVTLRFALRAFHCLVVLATHRSSKGADLILAVSSLSFRVAAAWCIAVTSAMHP
jgi:hypothetical protein